MLHLLQIDTTSVVAKVGYINYMTHSVTMVIILMIGVAVAGVLAQLHLRGMVRKYSRMTTSKVLSGGAVVERMLREHAIYNVRIKRARSDQDDHFDHRTMTLTLSDDVYESCSIMAVATAAHECGYAVQYVTGYRPSYMRLRLVPVMKIASHLAGYVMLGGILFMAFTNSALLCWLGIMLVALAVLIAMMTLGVEYNATKRAISWFEECGEFTADELDDLHEALRWVARTPMIEALSEVVMLLYRITHIRNRR
jgi:Zn-dependent membrane protease YugP